MLALPAKVCGVIVSTPEAKFKVSGLPVEALNVPKATSKTPSLFIVKRLGVPAVTTVVIPVPL